jgi:hypothetical protein
MTIYEEIARERKLQDDIHGGPEHDDEHTAEDWVAFICKQAGKSLIGIEHPARNRMICVAALAVAAVESIDRKTGVSKE